MDHNIVKLRAPAYEGGPAALLVDLGAQGCGIAYDTSGLFKGALQQPARKPKREKKEKQAS